ncbi:MAG TPA: GDSL-type esterase/lipase family protein [Streptosporangiaceae bacterium]
MIEGPPRVYIVYWGNQWGAAGTNSKGDYTFSNDAQSMVPRQQDLFRDLGANGETWSGVTTQYCDFVNKGDKSCPSSNPDHVGYPTGGALAGVWYDDSAPEPSSTSGNDIANEAIRAAQHFGNTSSGSNLNNQYVITSPPGIDPAGVYKGGACAWHSSTTQLPWSGDDVAYTNMPYIPDAPANSSGVPGSSCGVGAVNTPGTLDGVTIVGGHEYAETLTDAFGNGGWCGTNGCGADENGDKCAWGTNGAVLQNVPFSKTDNFPMQPTWANDGGGNGSCEINHPIVSDPNPNTPGAKILVVGDSITNGILGDYTWRYRLWQHLSTTSSQNVQFVGHRTGTENIYDDPGDLDLVNGNPAPTDNYANPTDGYYNSTVDSQFTCFDCGENHDALWGWTYVLAQNYIGQEVKTYQPNYMLIELGFNDLAFFTSPSGTLANAKALIDDARAVDPGIKVLIANVVTRVPLPNFPTLNSTIQTYNSDLAAAVPSWSTAQSPVRMADISSGYDPGTMSYDGLHPNWRGEYEIADAFGTALAQDFGLGTVPGAPPSSVPGYTLTAPSSVDASISATGTLLQWNRVYGVSGYRVYERDITGNPSPLPAFVELPLPLPGDHWYAGWGTPGHTYQYEVAAAKGNTESGPSAPVTITMPNPEPTADPPTNITDTPSRGTSSIALSWTAPTGSSYDANIDRYDVYWEDATQAAACGCSLIPNVAYPTGTSYTITGLIPGDTYDLAVASHTSDHGEGPWGGVPQAIVGDGTPGAPVISAGPNNTLTWSAVPGATGYWIYSGTQSIGSPVTWTRLQFEVPQGWNGSLVPGLYAVTAANGTLESAKSNSIAFTSAAAKKLIARVPSPASWIPAWLRAVPNAPALAMLEQRA